MKQRTLAMMTGFGQYTRKTRRAIFLEEMEQVVPWGELCALVAPHYPQPGKGRPPVGVERMLRIYFLQQWFNLSDPGVEEALYDSAVMRQFVAGADHVRTLPFGKGQLTMSGTSSSGPPLWPLLPVLDSAPTRSSRRLVPAAWERCIARAIRSSGAMSR